MNADPVKELAQAVLYEGYALYPYRRSALKNRRRWSFGVLFPTDYCSKQDPSERPLVQTECLLEGTAQSKIEVTVRFLQQLDTERTVEREVRTGALRLEELLQRGAFSPIAFEPDLEGSIEVSATPAVGPNFRLTVRVLNQSPFTGGSRDQALASAFISIHSLLAAQGGRFHSMIDPPEALRESSAQCRNVGTWPVLVGPEGSHDRMFSCAILLHDYPRIASSSPGDLFDATEIDEMLALRVRTLTEAEKESLRQEAGPIRSILERSDELSEETLGCLHASMSPQGTSGCPYRKGDRVRLRPAGRADIFDLVLAGATAAVISIEQDFEGQFHLAVVIDADPGRDLGLEGKPGHRFFFRPDEVERL